MNLITVTKDERTSPPPGEHVRALARELAQRLSGGVEVLLLWYPETDQVELSVRDSTTGAGFQVEVAPDQAIDAFNHPYTYAPRLEGSYGLDRDEAVIVDG